MENSNNFDYKYSLRINQDPIIFSSNKEEMLKMISDKFGNEAALNVSKWDDDYEGREFVESYIGKNHSFVIISIM